MFFFFFKQKTAYEMRISDWSSDVCSSDLSQKRNIAADAAQVDALAAIRNEYGLNPHRLQIQETMARHTKLDNDLLHIIKDPTKKREHFTQRLDRLLIHTVWGYVIFFGLLLLIFQAIYTWSGPFMDAIDNGFAWLDRK